MVESYTIFKNIQDKKDFTFLRSVYTRGEKKEPRRKKKNIINR